MSVSSAKPTALLEHEDSVARRCKETINDHRNNQDGMHVVCGVYGSRRETAIGSMMHTACPWCTFSVLCPPLRYLCQALLYVDIYLNLVRKLPL